MPRIPLRLPAPGENPIADAIRKRRAPRDLTPLDGILLNNPEIANGWNSLLGAVRTKNSLPGDVRELLILRVAARNQAVYEWIHHEHVGRSAGLTTAQLSVIRDVVRPIPGPENPGVLSSLQAAALAYGDAMTRDVAIPQDIFNALKAELKKLEEGTEDQKLMEVSATVATYNMVSRLLVSLDVGDKNGEMVPYPGTETAYHNIDVGEGIHLNIRVTVGKESDKPWIIFVNSLMTNLTMWDGVVGTLAGKYNIVCYDQRGHGGSSIPAQPCTIEQLADDIAIIISALHLPTPLDALIGVSQGGATVLCTATRHSDLFAKYIACDTQAKSPEANRAAWDERIALARSAGMQVLASATVARWFPPGSEYVQGRYKRLVTDMVAQTPLEGFIAGARALQAYDLTNELSDAFKNKKGLLIAGALDGGLPDSLKRLSESLQKDDRNVKFETIPGAGHLPMVDQTARFVQVVGEFLES